MAFPLLPGVVPEGYKAIQAHTRRHKARNFFEDRAPGRRNEIFAKRTHFGPIVERRSPGATTSDVKRLFDN